MDIYKPSKWIESSITADISREYSITVSSVEEEEEEEEEAEAEAEAEVEVEVEAEHPSIIYEK
jgi:hypothetical protein